MRVLISDDPLGHGCGKDWQERFLNEGPDFWLSISIGKAFTHYDQGLLSRLKKCQSLLNGLFWDQGRWERLDSLIIFNLRFLDLAH